MRRERNLELDLEHSSRVIEHGFNALQLSPSKAAAQREQGILLADALSYLPSDYREVLVLRHFEDLSFAEVGERMDRSLDSVQKLWVRRQLPSEAE